MEVGSHAGERWPYPSSPKRRRTSQDTSKGHANVFRFVAQGTKAQRKPRIRRSHIDGYTDVFRIPAASVTPTETGCSSVSVLQPDGASVVSQAGYDDAALGLEHDEAIETIWPLDHGHQLVPTPNPKHGWNRASSMGSGTSFSLGYDHDTTQYDQDYFSLSQGVLYHTPSRKAEGILKMYDQDFCVLPLTMDCQSNPFRVKQDNYERSAFLLHAVLAISAQHLAKKQGNAMLATEAFNHYATAIHLFRQALDGTPSLRLLDTLVVLVNFEATQSALGAWDVHLTGARRLLGGIDIAQVCRNSPKTEAQLAMLVWWDITIAFISRRNPSLPRSYLEVLSQNEHENGWNFFDLNGCPIELVLHMANLAKLASIYEKVIGLEHITFDHAAVDDIMTAIRDWRNPAEITLEDAEDATYDLGKTRDKYHCIEAWRHGILLYCSRVFHRPASSMKLRVTTHLARIVIDHVRCIPQTEITQKQTLLPLFLAAAETGARRDRDFVRQYCLHWSETARYNMFSSTLTLLERIWENWSVTTRDVYWWGSVVQHTDVASDKSVPCLISEHLLG